MRRFICVCVCFCVFFCFILLHSCCIIVSMVEWTWWDWSLILRTYLHSVLWHCWLGDLTRKNQSPIWPIMCLVKSFSLSVTRDDGVESDDLADRNIKLRTVWQADVTRWLGEASSYSLATTRCVCAAAASQSSIEKLSAACRRCCVVILVCETVSRMVSTEPSLIVASVGLTLLFRLSYRSECLIQNGI